jgi:hypothetical protein
MHKTTIYLSEELRSEIKLASRKEGRTEADIIRTILDDHFDRRRNDLPSIFGQWSGGTIRGAESEDWLRENWHPE